jgi:hypothetical protein
MNWGGKVNTSLSSLREVEIIHTRGTITRQTPAIRTAYRMVLQSTREILYLSPDLAHPFNVSRNG